MRANEARFGLEASVTIKEEKGHRPLPRQQQKRLSPQIRLYFKIQVRSLKIVCSSNCLGSNWTKKTTTLENWPNGWSTRWFLNMSNQLLMDFLPPVISCSCRKTCCYWLKGHLSLVALVHKSPCKSDVVKHTCCSQYTVIYTLNLYEKYETMME